MGGKYLPTSDISVKLPFCLKPQKSSLNSINLRKASSFNFPQKIDVGTSKSKLFCHFLLGLEEPKTHGWKCLENHPCNHSCWIFMLKSQAVYCDPTKLWSHWMSIGSILVVQKVLVSSSLVPSLKTCQKAFQKGNAIF